MRNKALKLATRLIASMTLAENQYEIQEGKYYLLRINVGKSKWNPYAMIRRRETKSEDIVKVIKVYEDSRWYGSERTIVYKNIVIGEIGKATPNATIN